MQQEKSLIIIKPDALQRGFAGQIISRLENKGLKIIGTKMMHLDEAILKEHYAHVANKPFYPRIEKFMKSAPVIVLAVSGLGAVAAIRTIVGPTKGYEAPAGTIRGDFSMSQQSNVVHASDSVENGEREVARFFKDCEIIEWDKLGEEIVYSDSVEESCD